MIKTELVTTLKRQATAIIGRLREDRHTVLITQHGRPAAYLMDVETFEGMNDRMKILEGIARGEKALQEGRGLSHNKARLRMRRWLR